MVSSVKASDSSHQNGQQFPQTPKRKHINSDNGQDVLNYVLKVDSIRKCWIKDVLGMPAAKNGDTEKTVMHADYYCLGLRNVPVRTVEVLGMVVGVLVKENKVIYTVDDGTGVVDCHEMHQRRDGNEPHPIARNGRTVTVVGRIERKFEDRIIISSKIELCRSNDEPRHWVEVSRLHREEYDPVEAKGPWTVPAVSPYKTPKPKILSPAAPQVSPSLSTDNDSTTSGPSPSKPISLKSKLSHPSKLSHVQLTEHTFRVYMRWYMDRAGPAYHNYRQQGRAPLSPTNSFNNDLDATPRAKRSFSHSKSLDPPIMRMSLSHLRRVPELALLARRIARHKQRKRASTSAASATAARHKESLSSKEKRLFTMTINSLVHDAELVLWESGEEIPAPALYPDIQTGDWCFDWSRGTCASSSSSKRTQAHDRSGISAASTSGGKAKVDWRGEVREYLSDIQPSSEYEESYTPLNSAVLSPALLQTLRALASRYHGKQSAFAIDSILRGLKRNDVWRYVGEDRVRECLEGLENDGVVVECRGKGWKLR